MKNIISSNHLVIIDGLCRDYNIENYNINSDGTVDVDGSVEIFMHQGHELPIKFRYVSGNFCIRSTLITSLDGCPKEVGGNFVCFDNHNLESLVGCPEKVGGNFKCSSNSLTSLVGCPSVINGNFICRKNNISNMNGCPSVIRGDFDLLDNPLVTLYNFPSAISDEFYFDVTVFPIDANDKIRDLSTIGRRTFKKYHSMYGIWCETGLVVDRFLEFIEDIKDGLR